MVTGVFKNFHNFKLTKIIDVVVSIYKKGMATLNLVILDNAIILVAHTNLIIFIHSLQSVRRQTIQFLDWTAY